MKVGKHARELGKDVLTYGLFYGLSQASGLILLPLLTRVLSVEEYGIVDLFATFTALLGTLLRLGLPSAVQRFYFEADSPEERQRLAGSLFSFVLLVGAAVSVVISVSVIPFVQNGAIRDVGFVIIPLGCLVATLNAAIAVPQAVLRLERKISRYSLTNIVNTVLYLLLAVAAVTFLGLGVKGVFYAQATALLVSIVVCYLATRPFLRIGLWKPLMKGPLAYGLPIVPGVLVAGLNSHADRLVLLSLLGVSSVALFGVAVKVSLLFNFAVDTFRQAWQPYAMTLLKAKERDEVFQISLDCYLAGFCWLALALTALAPPLFSVLAPAEYAVGADLVPWLAGTVLLHNSASIANLGVILSKRTILITWASLLSLVSNLVLSIVLIQAFGIPGAAIGSFGAELILTALRLKWSFAYSSLRFSVRRVVTVLTTYVFAAALILYCHRVEQPVVSYSLKMGVLLGAGALSLRFALSAEARRLLFALVRRTAQ